MADNERGNATAEVRAPSYTRTGDDGKTTLGDLSRVSKTDSRIEAYAACEEANSAIGVAVGAATGLAPSLITVLGRVQNDLVEVQGDLSTPLTGGQDRQLRIDDAYVRRVEEACDHYDQDIPQANTFVLPSGTQAGALLYQAATFVRRAERATWRVLEVHGDANAAVGRYLNRLSTLLQVLGRVCNAEHGDVVWQPGLTANVGLLPRDSEAGEQA